MPRRTFSPMSELEQWPTVVHLLSSSSAAPTSPPSRTSWRTSTSVPLLSLGFFEAFLSFRSDSAFISIHIIDVKVLICRYYRGINEIYYIYLFYRVYSSVVRSAAGACACWLLRLLLVRQALPHWQDPGRPRTASFSIP